MKKGLFLLATGAFIIACSLSDFNSKASTKFVAEDILILMGNIPPVIYPPTKIDNAESAKIQLMPVQHSIQNKELI